MNLTSFAATYYSELRILGLASKSRISLGREFIRGVSVCVTRTYRVQIIKSVAPPSNALMQ